MSAEAAQLEVSTEDPRSTADEERVMSHGQASSSGREAEDCNVVLHASIISAMDHKVASVLSVFLVLVSLVAFSYSLTFKLTPEKILFRHTIVQSVNVGFGSLNICVLCILMWFFVINWGVVWQANLTWPRRTVMVSFIAFAQLVVQFINTVFFVFPNVHSQSKQCSWFQRIQFISGTVRWTCWNTYFLLAAIHTHNLCPWLDKRGNFRRGRSRGPLIIMDAPIWIHLPKFVFWAVFEFCIVFLAAKKNYDYKIVVKGRRRFPCLERLYECQPGTEHKVLTTMWVIFIFLYVCMIQTYIMQARRRLLLGRYNEFLHVHLMVLRQRRQAWYITIIGVVIVPVLWYTRWNRCNNYFVSWLGLLPLQVIVTAMAAVNAYYFMPVPPGKQSVKQEWLQQFAWDEATLQSAKEDRSKDKAAKVVEQLDKEPMFCFETAVKLALWSEVVYAYGIEAGPLAQAQASTSSRCCGCLPLRPALSGTSSAATLAPADEKVAASMHKAGHIEIPIDGELSARSTASSLQSTNSIAKVEELTEEKLMKAAMEMYDLEYCEIMAEEQLQTRALIGWSGANLVVAFRGTATMANVISDAKAWRMPHPPARGTWILGQQPRVHKGFLQTWTVNGFNHRVIQRLKAIYDERTVPASAFAIKLTGHSLGSALAQLAALELQRTYNLTNVSVYGYGCPRVGNHAFCRELNELVPDHWQLINDRDAVPRTAKFYILYKRAGQRVLLNQVGDIRVRPSVLEMSIHSSGYSIKQHLMASYVSSLFSVCMAQCMEFKCEPGGRQGVQRLAKNEQIQAYFASAGLDLRASVTGDGDVILPSLIRKQTQFSWWSDNCLWSIFSMLEDLVPGLEEEGGFMGIMHGRTATDIAQAAVAEDNEQAHPDQLSHRLETLQQTAAMMKLRRSSEAAAVMPPETVVAMNKNG